MKDKKNPEIIDKELWDHYSELPNPAWYEYKEKKEGEINIKFGRKKVLDTLWNGDKLNHKGHWYVRLTDVVDVLGDS